MKPEEKDTTIADIHRIREQIATKFGGDLFAINADARTRMEQSGRTIIRRPQHTDVLGSESETRKATK